MEKVKDAIVISSILVNKGLICLFACVCVCKEKEEYWEC